MASRPSVDTGATRLLHELTAAKSSRTCSASRITNASDDSTVPSCLQMAKIHFGVLLGWTLVQSIVLWFIVNQISSSEVAEHRLLDLYSCCCIVGYGLVPLIVLSAVVLLIPK